MIRFFLRNAGLSPVWRPDHGARGLLRRSERDQTTWRQTRMSHVCCPLLTGSVQAKEVQSEKPGLLSSEAELRESIGNGVSVKYSRNPNGAALRWRSSCWSDRSR